MQYSVVMFVNIGLVFVDHLCITEIFICYHLLLSTVLCSFNKVQLYPYNIRKMLKQHQN